MDSIQALANHMTTSNTMTKSHLAIAQQLIELKYNVVVTSIEFEDGSGRSFNITTKSNPLKKQHVRV
jgi:hypothetical protein